MEYVLFLHQKVYTVINDVKSHANGKRTGTQQVNRQAKKRIALIITTVVIFLLICAWGAFSVIMYNMNVNQRFESYEPLMLHVDDFEGLHTDMSGSTIHVHYPIAVFA